MRDSVVAFIILHSAKVTSLSYKAKPAARAPMVGNSPEIAEDDAGAQIIV